MLLLQAGMKPARQTRVLKLLRRCGNDPDKAASYLITRKELQVASRQSLAKFLVAKSRDGQAQDSGRKYRRGRKAPRGSRKSRQDQPYSAEPYSAEAYSAEALSAEAN